MKKIVTVLIVLSILVIPVNVFAAEEYYDDKVISFYEYYNAVHAEYEKYGVNYEVIQKNDDFVFTQKILQEKLSEINALYANQLEDPCYVKYNQSYDGNDLTKGILPSKQTYRHRKMFTCPAAPGLAYAEICLEVVAEVDVQYNDLMSIVSSDSYQLGSYLNFVSWTQRNINVTPDYMSDSIAASATGILKFEYTEPTTGLLVGHSSEQTISKTFYVK